MYLYYRLFYSNNNIVCNINAFINIIVSPKNFQIRANSSAYDVTKFRKRFPSRRMSSA